ncbi:WD40/YVTN/BNR-like repeat-containing protein [Parvularcula maris]|uniref:Photosynthesis system II assembly factor Ycf48/Hcf136-like domain-containing protein n=1 Tax=Parvularcula maris TaxID=2965077 RepID=A0A9X2RI68_9PROT|nr:hypothetical protein [Parvularcula maris]MCQ8184636.1 hypothetical protein [Parvularcula maris]
MMNKLVPSIGVLVLTACASTPVDPPSTPRGYDLTGSAWQTLDTEAYPGKRDDIAVVDRDRAWYGTGQGELYATTDGGASWSLVRHQPGTFIRALAFLDDRTGFVGNIGTDYYPGVSDDTPLYRTDDGGSTWTPVAVDGAPITGVCAIDILRTDRVFQGKLENRMIIHAAGRVGGPTGMLRSVDGGESFTSIDLSAQAGMVLDVVFLTEFEGLVFASTGRDPASTEGLILRTEDGGESWSEVYRSGRPGELIWKASFPTEETGYATVMSYDPSNPQQLVLKTEDGGRTWTELPLVENANARQFGIGFVDERSGFVGTMAGGFQTTDGGSSWQPVPIAPAANNFSVVEHPDGATIWAIGTEVQKLEVERR